MKRHLSNNNMENSWNNPNGGYPGFSSMHGGAAGDVDEKEGIKRPKLDDSDEGESDDSDDGQESVISSPPPSGNDNSLNLYPIPLAHSTPRNQQPQQQPQQHLQHLQQLQPQPYHPNFSNLAHPILQNHLAADYQVYQQHQQQLQIQHQQHQQQVQMQQHQQQQMQQQPGIFQMQQQLYNSVYGGGIPAAAVANVAAAATNPLNPMISGSSSNSSVQQQYQQLLNNTHSSGSSLGSSEDDSGNSSSLLIPAQDDLPANHVKFCTVPGRLSLLGSNKKIEVTLAEIQRRIAAPECLNQSILSAILRKAKNKDGGNKLNADLKRYNITLTQGRRKSAPNTAFTALVEAESIILATDFQKLSEKQFPFNSFAYEFLKQIQSLEDYRYKSFALQSSNHILHCFLSILGMDKTPVACGELNPQIFMHPDSQKDFTSFSLLTHGFGTPAHTASWITQMQAIRTLFEAFRDPSAFCAKIGRPMPEMLAVILNIINQQQQAIAAQQQQQQQQPQQQQAVAGFPQFSTNQPQQSQPSQQQQQPPPQMPKNPMNGY